MGKRLKDNKRGIISAASANRNVSAESIKRSELELLGFAVRGVQRYMLYCRTVLDIADWHNAILGDSGLDLVTSVRSSAGAYL
jgi:hypothetical protein